MGMNFHKKMYHTAFLSFL